MFLVRLIYLRILLTFRIAASLVLLILAQQEVVLSTLVIVETHILLHNLLTIVMSVSAGYSTRIMV